MPEFASMRRFFLHFRVALWRAFQHDAFAVAKGAAFSAIFAVFPAVLLVASVLSESHKTEAFIRETGRAVGRILPSGTSTAVLQYFSGTKPASVRTLITLAAITRSEERRVGKECRSR